MTEETKEPTPIVARTHVGHRLILTIDRRGFTFNSKTARFWRQGDDPDFVASRRPWPLETHVYPCDFDGKPFEYIEYDGDWLCFGRHIAGTLEEALANHAKTVRSYRALASPWYRP